LLLEVYRQPMSTLFAICPHCAKNIILPSDVFDSADCPLCSGPLTMELLRMKNSIIDMQEANIAFETGKQHFDNINFGEAGVAFKKALEFNQNHYLSFYYAGLCDIYENEANPEYDKPLNLMRLLKLSLMRLDSAQVDVKYKISFVLAAAHEVFIMLQKEFYSIAEALDSQKGPRNLRHALILMAKHVNSFLGLDKELLLVFDPSIAESVLGLVNLAIAACVKSTMSYPVSDVSISVPNDEDFDATQKIYGNLLYFAQSVKPDFSIESHRPDFSGTQMFNSDTRSVLDTYYNNLDKRERSAFLAVKGEVLRHIKRQCKTGVLLAYHTLYKNLYIKMEDPIRKALLTQAAEFSFEVLYPRIHLNPVGRPVIECATFEKQSAFTPYLDAFLHELYDENKKTTVKLLDDFYKQVSDMTHLYFNNVKKSMAKTLGGATKGKEFEYHVQFFGHVVNACSIALQENIEFVAYLKKSKWVIQLLKLGKLAAEEFLLLYNYNLDELEKTATGSQLIYVYNRILSALDTK